MGARARALTGVKLASAGLGFAMVASFSKTLGPETWGQIALTLSVAGLFAVLGNYGQHFALVRSLPGSGRLSASDDIQTAFAKAAIASTCVGAIAIFGLITFAQDREGIWLAATVFLAVAFATCELLAHAMRGLGAHFAAILPRDVFWRVFCILACLILAEFFDPQNTHIFAIMCAGMACVIGVQAVMLFRLVRRLPETTDKIGRKPQNDRALWVGSVSAMFLAYADSLIIGWMFGPVAAGGYFVLNRMAQLLGFIAVGEHQSIAPEIARTFHAGDRMGVEKIARAASARMTKLTFLGWVVFLLAVDPIVAYLELDLPQAIWVCFWLGAAAFANAAMGPGDIVLNMAGQEGPASRAALVAIALASVAILAGSIFAGLPGAAFGVFVATSARKCLFYLVCLRLLGIRPSCLRDLVARAPVRAAR
jgi:O-antigen/teichoic acid export membrane protein